MSRRRRGPSLRIETDRFYLESLEPASAQQLSGWLGSTRVSEALAQAPATRSPEQLAAYIASFDRVNDHIFGIGVKATGDLVGIYTLKVDPVHLTGAITIVIGKESALQQAIARETARALVDWAFDHRGVEKIAARVADTNRITSGWLGSRMTLEGHLREHIRLPDGSRAGVLLYGLLKSEWPAVRERSIQRQEEWQASADPVEGARLD